MTASFSLVLRVSSYSCWYLHTATQKLLCSATMQPLLTLRIHTYNLLHDSKTNLHWLAYTKSRLLKALLDRVSDRMFFPSIIPLDPTLHYPFPPSFQRLCATWRAPCPAG